MYKTVFIGSKPSVNIAAAPYVLTKFSRIGEPVLFLSLCYLGHHRFDFPRGIPYRDYPVVTTPAYKRDEPRFLPLEGVLADKGSFVDKPVLDINRLEPMGFNEVKSVMEKCRDIVVMPDIDHTEIKACQLLLDDVHPFWKDSKKIRWVFPKTFSHEDMVKAFDSKETCGRMPAHAWVRKVAGDIKHYFDYNFTANSMPILGKTAAMAGVDLKGGHLSKYQIMALFILDRQGPLGEGPLLGVLENWKGSGKYDSVEIGSPASRAKIIEGLCQVGLVARTREEGLAPTPAGKRFLGLLHPDCFDPDLPARIRHWMRQGKCSKAAISRYIRTWFDRQKRFMAGQEAGTTWKTPDMPGKLVMVILRVSGDDTEVEVGDINKSAHHWQLRRLMTPAVSVGNGVVTGRIPCLLEDVEEAKRLLSDEVAMRVSAIGELAEKAKKALA